MKSELHTLRKSGFPRSSLAQIFGVHESTICRWESGRTKPSLAEATALKGLVRIVESAAPGSAARDTIDGLLNFSSGAGPGIAWMAKWGAMLATSGLAGVLFAAMTDATRDAARKSVKGQKV